MTINIFSIWQCPINTGISVILPKKIRFMTLGNGFAPWLKFGFVVGRAGRTFFLDLVCFGFGCFGSWGGWGPSSVCGASGLVCAGFVQVSLGLCSYRYSGLGLDSGLS